jgi:hypothetical protein
VGLFSSATAQASAPMMDSFRMEPKAFARQVVHNPVEYKCLVKLWTFESNWNPKSRNRIPVYQVRKGKRVALHAFGIAQLLGETSRISYVQIQNGLRYLESRYDGSACKALNWHLRHHWY